MMAPKCLFSSPWIPVVLFTILNQLPPSQSTEATYRSYDVRSDRVCNRYRKRELEASMSQPIILETRNATLDLSNSMALSCDFEVEAMGGSRIGVMSVVQAMNFRVQGDSCIDYIQTIYKLEKKGIKIKLPKKKKKDKTRRIIKTVIKGVKNRSKRDSDDDDRGPRICGSVLLGMHVDQNETLPPPFANPLPPTKPSNNESLLLSLFTDQPNPYQSLVSDAAEVDHRRKIISHLYVSNRMLRINESVNFKIVYTAYRECDGRHVPHDLFHCGYGMCISKDLVNDGFVNCPFGDCADETNCTNAKASPITAKVIRYKPTEASSSGFSLWTLVLVVLVVLVVGGAIYYCCNKRKKSKAAKAAEEADEEEEGDKTGGDATTEFSDPSKQQPYPAYPNQPYQQPPGYMPPPGGQPGYYPMVPPQGYPQYPPQQPPYVGQAAPPPGYPGAPPPGVAGYPTPPEGAPPAAYPAQGVNYPPSGNAAEAPVYPTAAAPQQSAPPLPTGGNTIGFGYPPQPMPTAAPYPVNNPPQ